MKDIKKWTVIVFCCLFIQPVLAQNKKLDRLEMLYDQGNYEIVYRKAKRYLNKPEFDNSANPSFYKALAIYRMAQQGDTKFTIEKSLDAYQTFLVRHQDPVFLKAHHIEITDFKKGLIDYATRMKEINKESESQHVLAQVNRLFNENHNYADLIKDPFKENKTDIANSKGKSDKNVRDDVIDYSKQFIGVPYVWGGDNPKGFDCSGFTKYVLKEYGYDLPRIAGDQYTSGKHVKLKDATKGDLVFFGSKKSVQHVGIVVSEPGEELTMIHASSSRGIMVSNIEKSSYWKPKLLYASRVIQE